jgi:DNA-binding XRE family transcriptional regulator
VALPARDVFVSLVPIAFVPVPVEVLGRNGPELDDEVAREILRIDLAPFFAPHAEQCRLVIAHDDPGIGAPYKWAAFRSITFSRAAWHGTSQNSWSGMCCGSGTCDNGTITMPVTSAQVRMARAALNWTVRDLAEATRLHRNTISNIETGRYAGDVATLAAIANVLKRAGVQFIDENGGGPGVRLRKRTLKKE